MDEREPESTHYVSQNESEALIAAVERGGRDDRAGIFGPHSLSWTINRESALFLGAGRAALLQLAHPWVAAALEQHSSLMANPIGRFHSTFRIVFTTLFGSTQQAAAAARHLYQVHTFIQGELPQSVGAFAQGSRYVANEVAALRWVYATLVESAVLAYDFVLPPLREAEREQYYAESKTLATLFGLTDSAMPQSWNGFVAYCREMEQSAQLGVSDAARGMAHGLLRGAGSWVKPPRWYHALTAAWLPERLRTEFGLTLSGEDQRAIESSRSRLRWWYPRLPQAVRFVGPWHEAKSRLAGHAPGLIARAGNRFWMGQARMPFAS